MNAVFRNAGREHVSSAWSLPCLNDLDISATITVWHGCLAGKLDHSRTESPERGIGVSHLLPFDCFSESGNDDLVGFSAGEVIELFDGIHAVAWRGLRVVVVLGDLQGVDIDLIAAVRRHLDDSVLAAALRENGHVQEAAAIAAQNPCLACGLSYEVRPIESVRATRSG